MPYQGDLARIWERIWILTDKQADLQSQVSGLHRLVTASHPPQEVKTVRSEVLAILKEALSPKVVVIVLFLVAASLMGIISPQQIISTVMSQNGEHEQPKP